MGFALRLFDCLRDFLDVVAFLYLYRVPPICFKALRDIFGERKACGAGERDQIVIVQIDQLAESKMAG